MDSSVNNENRTCPLMHNPQQKPAGETLAVDSVALMT